MEKPKCIDVLLLMVVLATNASGQSMMSAVVLGAGGGSSGNGSARICATVGQPVTGDVRAPDVRAPENILQQGFWHRLLNPAAAETGPREVPVTGERALAPRIWPNPSSGRADLFVDIPVAGHVTAVLHDMRGNAVHTLHNGLCQPGGLNIPLDGTHLPSGAYTVVLTAGAKRAMVAFHLAR